MTVFRNGELIGAYKLKGQNVAIESLIAAMDKKITFCPRDRKIAGIIEDLSVRENVILAMQTKDGMFRHISYDEQVKFADEFIKLLRIKVLDREQLIKNLSGGNCLHADRWTR